MPSHLFCPGERGLSSVPVDPHQQSAGNLRFCSSFFDGIFFWPPLGERLVASSLLFDDEGPVSSVEPLPEQPISPDMAASAAPRVGAKSLSARRNPRQARSNLQSTLSIIPCSCASPLATVQYIQSSQVGLWYDTWVDCDARGTSVLDRRADGRNEGACS